MPFVLFYNIATGIFSALGDSKTPFYFLAASSTANIAVDILFVTVLRMGVAGVAWATFICQGISCIVAVLVVFRRLAGIETDKVSFFSFGILKRIMTVAVPSILQQSFISVGNIIIQGTINGFGPGVMAGYLAAVKLNNLVITSFTTLGNGISNYTAQNIGAGKMLRILSPFYFIISMKFVADGILRGAGMMGKFMIATFLDLILRVGLAILLSHTILRETGIWCAWTIGWTVAALLSLMFYKTGKWNKQKKNG